MKENRSYRGAVRNAVRQMFYGFSRRPRVGHEHRRWAAWMHANVAAKLAERRKQCQEAVSLVAKALAQTAAGTHGAPRSGVILSTLRTFWSAQFGKGGTGSRVIQRILRDLGPEPLTVAAR